MIIDYIQYVSGYKNKYDEETPWLVVSKETGEIINSYKYEETARSFLREIWKDN